MNAYGVHYFLEKIDNKWINVIVVDDIVKTAYIIGIQRERLNGSNDPKRS